MILETEYKSPQTPIHFPRVDEERERMIYITEAASIKEAEELLLRLENLKK